ncbi:hypothetical protein HY991_01240 [Candidatus Micrarchaeota archaeon]|nr:hypothetical protein [Candidatus Micrarchaeota archaeon]
MVFKPVSREELRSEHAQDILANMHAPHEQRIPLLASVVHHLEEERRQEVSRDAPYRLRDLGDERQKTFLKAHSALEDYIRDPHNGQPSHDPHAREMAFNHFEQLGLAHSLCSFTFSPHPEIHGRAEQSFMKLVEKAFTASDSEMPYRQKEQVITATANTISQHARPSTASWVRHDLNFRGRLLDKIIEFASRPAPATSEHSRNLGDTLRIVDAVLMDGVIGVGDPYKRETQESVAYRQASEAQLREKLFKGLENRPFAERVLGLCEKNPTFHAGRGADFYYSELLPELLRKHPEFSERARKKYEDHLRYIGAPAMKAEGFGRMDWEEYKRKHNISQPIKRAFEL